MQELGRIIQEDPNLCAMAVNFGVQAAGARTFSRTISEF